MVRAPSHRKICDDWTTPPLKMCHSKHFHFTKKIQQQKTESQIMSKQFLKLSHSNNNNAANSNCKAIHITALQTQFWKYQLKYFLPLFGIFHGARLFAWSNMDRIHDLLQLSIGNIYIQEKIPILGMQKFNANKIELKAHYSKNPNTSRKTLLMLGFTKKMSFCSYLLYF